MPGRIEHDLSKVAATEEKVQERRRSPYRFLIIAAILSLLAHIGFVIVTALIEPPHFDVTNNEPIRVHMVSSSPKAPDIPQKQVVSIAPPNEQKRPNDPQYLAEYDQSVQEQTRARETSSQLGRPKARAPSQKPSPTVSPNGLLAKSHKAPPGPTMRDLLPTVGSDTMQEGTAFNDHLDGVQVDNETKLNAAQWTHATFFVRVKAAVARQWNPNKAIRRNDPKGTIAGTQDRITQVMASIDRDGKLLSVKVLKESGVFYLDDEALRAFRDAAPFTNPPQALFAQGNSFEFPFGFVLSYDKGFKFDLDWRPY